MKVKDVKNRYFRAFTMPEVALAVGVVAFGLVWCFRFCLLGLRLRGIIAMIR